MTAQTNRTADRSWSVEWYNIYAVVVLAAALLVAAYNLLNWRAWTPSDWATWVGSVGTAGTLIGTIWLASSETRDRRRQERTVALLTLASLRPELERAFNDFQLLQFGVSPAGPDDFDGNYRGPMVEELLSLKLWTADELKDLHALPDDLALRLAHVLGEVSRIAIELKQENWVRIMRERPPLLEGFMARTQEVMDTCNQAISVLKASKVPSPKAGTALQLGDLVARPASAVER